MLILVLVESALETIPEELWNYSSIRRFSRMKGKHQRFILLDRSYHHHAMKTLEKNEKRGRPDIVHFSLLEALGSPLNKEGLLRVYVHTIGDYVISIEPETRLPKNYNRFVGLIEDLFEHGKVPPRNKPLLTLEKKTLRELLDELKPTHVIAFDTAGKPKTIEEAVVAIAKEKKPLVMVGGFPHGSFEESTLNLVDELVCIDPEVLEAWTVVSRTIYEYERALRLPRKRIERMKTEKRS